MCSNSVLACLMTILSNFTILFIIIMFIFKDFLNKSSRRFPFCAISSVHYFSFFYKINFFIVCSFNSLLNFFIKFLPHDASPHLFISCLFFMLLNNDIIGIETLLEYVQLLLLNIIFQDYFYIHLLFYSKIQDKICIKNK